MDRVLRRWSIPLLILALVGGQSAGLQVAAWAGMLVARTQAQGLDAAIRSTFDGEHPCRLCAVVRELAAGETGVPAPDQPSPTKPSKPLDLHVPGIDGLAALDVGERPAWTIGVRALATQHRPTPEPPPPRIAGPA
jgi:hypothetical protein